MALVRITVDVRTGEPLDDEKMDELADRTRAYVNGAVTTLALNESDIVGNSSAHVHVSGSYACDTCTNLARDGLS